jgi:hypothetical protein
MQAWSLFFWPEAIHSYNNCVQVLTQAGSGKSCGGGDELIVSGVARILAAKSVRKAAFRKTFFI